MVQFVQNECLKAPTYSHMYCYAYAVLAACDLINKASVPDTVTITSWAKLFLLFIGKEWTNIIMAALWGPVFKRKSIFVTKKIIMKKKWYKWRKTANGPVGTFSTFLCQILFCLGSPLTFFAAFESTTGTFHTAMTVMSSDNLANCVTSSTSRTDTKHVVRQQLHCKQD